MNWKFYWKVVKNHTAKKLCSTLEFDVIDSFEMFRNFVLINLVRQSFDRVSLTVPRYSLVAKLNDDNSLSVTYGKGTYIISVEEKNPHYGGVYYFFRCPLCSARMRKLYCVEGQYQCRKCAKLGYLSQRLRPSERCWYGKNKVKQQLQNQAGSLDSKPPWIKRNTFQKARIKYVKYAEFEYNAINAELLNWYGTKMIPYLGDHFCFAIEDKLMDAYVKR